MDSPGESAVVAPQSTTAPLETPPNEHNNNSINNNEDGRLEQQADGPKTAPGLISKAKLQRQIIQIRLLVRRREAGALIGKKGCNIKRLRDSFSNSNFSIPDTGNGPERIVCISSDSKTMTLILNDITKLLLEKSPQRDDQIELKLLIHSWFAGLLIGMGGQSIKKLRNDLKAAIKIFEMCCPFSNERVCAIKAKPEIVVQTLAHIQKLIQDNPHKGTIKSYDALNFDLSLVDKYGGFLPEEISASPPPPPKQTTCNSNNSNSWRFSHNHQPHLAPHDELLNSTLRHHQPQLHSLLDTLYRQQHHQMLRWQQGALQRQQQLQRPIKRYSVWRATAPTSCDSKSPQQANCVNEPRETKPGTSESSKRPAAKHRYHPYQQAVAIGSISSLNEAKICRPETMINSVCEPILQLSNLPAWTTRMAPIRISNHQQLVQLQEMQQKVALFPETPMTQNNQNQASFNVCCNHNQNNMCQHVNQQQQLASAGPVLPCLCGLYMPLPLNGSSGAGQEQCDAPPSGSILESPCQTNECGSSISSLGPVESYANLINSEMVQSNNMTENQQQQQQQQTHSNLQITE